MTPALPPSTDRRSCIVPGGASNTTRDGPRDGAPPPAAEAGGEEEFDVVASATSGTRPRKYGLPSLPTAVTATRAGCWLSGSGGDPGARGIGSHTNVTRVLPFSPRDVPSQVRIARAFDAADVVATPASAAVTAVGTGAFGAAVDSAISSCVSAQYPLRARTCTPGRFTRTLISWNFP